MTVNIEIADYLSENDIKQICKDEVKYMVRAALSKESDIERFLTNSSYHFVWDAVNELCPDNMFDILTETIPKIVKNLSSFSVFSPRNAWDKEESRGWTILQKVLSESEPMIRERVYELIREINLYMIQDIITEQIGNAIENLKEKQQ